MARTRPKPAAASTMVNVDIYGGGAGLLTFTNVQLSLGCALSWWCVER